MSINGYDISEIYSFLVGRIDLFHQSYIDNPRPVKAINSRALTDVQIQDWGKKRNSTSRDKSYNYLKQDKVLRTT